MNRASLSQVLKLQVRGSGASNPVDQKGSGLPQKEFDIMGQVEKNARLYTKMSTVVQKITFLCCSTAMSAKQLDSFKPKGMTFITDFYGESSNLVRDKWTRRKDKVVVQPTLHNAYIEQLDSSVYKIEPYIILSYLL